MTIDILLCNVDERCRHREPIKDYIISDDKYMIFHFPRKLLTLNSQFLLEANE